MKVDVQWLVIDCGGLEMLEQLGMDSSDTNKENLAPGLACMADDATDDMRTFHRNVGPFPVPLSALLPFVRICGPCSVSPWP